MRGIKIAFAMLCVIGAMSLGVERPQAADGAAGPSRAQPEPRVGEFRGEWQRAGAGFGCRVAAGRKLSVEEVKSKAFAVACQHIGPFIIGGDAQTLVTALGTPNRMQQRPKGATAMVYFLGGPGIAPYLVATVAQSSIVALQVTGPAPAAGKDFSFNHVDLGDGTDTLVKYFGAAKHMSPSEIKDTDVWTYGPFPFSFEVKDSRVTSIRITDPEWQ
jgi:hypothetical protein